MISWKLSPPFAFHCSFVFQSMLNSLMSFFKGSEEVPQVDTHWISESGIIDVFVMLGPKPHDVFSEYASFTGTTALPPVSLIQNATSPHMCPYIILIHCQFWEFNVTSDKTAKMNRWNTPLDDDIHWLQLYSAHVICCSNRCLGLLIIRVDGITMTRMM